MAAVAIAVLVVLLQAAAPVSSQERQWSAPPRGLLESVVSRTSQALQSLWSAPGAEAGKGVPGSVPDDWYSCAQQAKEQYAALVRDARRSAERCWGWEPREVEALGRALEDLLLAGDRLPALLRQRMDACLHQPPRVQVRVRRASPGPDPSPFRVLRCSVQCAGVAWSYVSAVPREALRVARRSAALLGSSREDWMSCSQGVLRQSARPAVQLVKELGICVADHLAQHYWESHSHQA